MNANNQSIIIIFLGIALIMSIYLGYTQFTDFILGIFGGVFMQKTLTEKQEEILEQHTIKQSGEDE